MILRYQNNSFCCITITKSKQTPSVVAEKRSCHGPAPASATPFPSVENVLCSVVPILCEPYTLLCQTQTKIKYLFMRFLLLHFLLKGNKNPSGTGGFKHYLHSATCPLPPFLFSFPFSSLFSLSSQYPQTTP